MKLYEVVDEGVKKGYYFDCPGCKMGHSIIARPYDADTDARWGFNGDVESPTFAPSILARYSSPDGKMVSICHLYVRDGWLHFLGDSRHELAGQSVVMEDITEEED